MLSYCSHSFILTAMVLVYSTCLSHTEALCFLPSGLEGRVQLFRDVSYMLGLPVNAAPLNKQTRKMKDIMLHVCAGRDNYSKVEVGLGG